MKRTALLSIVAFVLLVVPSLAQQSLTDQIDTYIYEKYLPGEPGAAVLVVKDGNVVLRKGYGLASISPVVVNNADMIFRIGSITKQFTSTAILQLVEKGKIDLN